MAVEQRTIPARPRKSSKRGRPATSAAKRMSLKSSPTLDTIPASPLTVISPASTNDHSAPSPVVSPTVGKVEIGPPCEDRYTELPPSFSSRYLRNLAQQRRRKQVGQSQWTSKSTMSSLASGLSIYEDATEGEDLSDDDRHSVRYSVLANFSKENDFTPKLNCEEYLSFLRSADNDIPEVPEIPSPTSLAVQQPLVTPVIVVPASHVIPLRRHSTTTPKTQPTSPALHARHMSEQGNAKLERPGWHPKPLVLTPNRTIKAPITHRPAYLHRPWSSSGFSNARLSRTASMTSSSSMRSSSASSGSPRMSSGGETSDTSFGTDVSSQPHSLKSPKRLERAGSWGDSSCDDSDRSLEPISDSNASTSGSSSPTTSLEPMSEEEVMLKAMADIAVPRLHVSTLPQSPPLIAFPDEESAKLVPRPRSSSKLSSPMCSPLQLSPAPSRYSQHFSPPPTPPPDGPLPTLPLFHPNVPLLNVSAPEATSPPSSPSALSEDGFVSAPSSPRAALDHPTPAEATVDLGALLRNEELIDSAPSSIAPSPAIGADNLQQVIQHLQLRKKLQAVEAIVDLRPVHSTIELPSSSRSKIAPRPSVVSLREPTTKAVEPSVAFDSAKMLRRGKATSSESLSTRSSGSRKELQPALVIKSRTEAVPASRKVPYHQLGLEPREPRAQLDLPDPVMRDLLNSTPPRPYIEANIRSCFVEEFDELIISMPVVKTTVPKKASPLREAPVVVVAAEKPEPVRAPKLAAATPQKPAKLPKVVARPLESRQAPTTKTPTKKIGNFFGILSPAKPPSAPVFHAQEAKPKTIERKRTPVKKRPESPAAVVSIVAPVRTDSRQNSRVERPPRSSIPDVAPRLSTPKMSMIDLNLELESSTFELDDLYAKLDAFEAEVLSPASATATSAKANSTASSFFGTDKPASTPARPHHAPAADSSLSESLLDSINRTFDDVLSTKTLAHKVSAPSNFKAALRAQALER